MEHILINSGKLKLMLTRADIVRYSLSGIIDGQSEDAEDPRVKKDALRQLLDEAGRIPGFDGRGRMFIQLYPSRDGGAEIYITRLTTREAEAFRGDEDDFMECDGFFDRRDAGVRGFGDEENGVSDDRVSGRNGSASDESIIISDDSQTDEKSGSLSFGRGCKESDLSGGCDDPDNVGSERRGAEDPFGEAVYSERIGADISVRRENSRGAADTAGEQARGGSDSAECHEARERRVKVSRTGVFSDMTSLLLCCRALRGLRGRAGGVFAEKGAAYTDGKRYFLTLRCLLGYRAYLERVDIRAVEAAIKEYGALTDSHNAEAYIEEYCVAFCEHCAVNTLAEMA